MKKNDVNTIDFVVTWVDDRDPVWRAKKEKYTGTELKAGNTEVRYRDWDTLKYWFRGVEKFAPWVRYVYFVTDDQKPAWLNLEHPKLKWIKHTDFIPAQYLPTFSAHPIEWNLHRINGLAEQFVYFNDDVFLIRKTKPEDFFVDGLPCDQPGVSMLYPAGFFEYMLFNNTVLLNRHFSLRDSIRRDWKKWVLHQSPKELLKLAWYGRRTLIPGCNDRHIHISYLKNTFFTLWDQEYDWIHDTCTHKQRTKQDLTPWCARNWQIFTGTFHLHKPIGRAYSTAQMESNGALEYIKKQKGKVICLNDVEGETSFQTHKQMLATVFEKLFPDKSAFEL